MPVNPELVKLAIYKVRQKQAFVPSDAVAGAGGGGAGGPPPGGDPSGGAPPGGPPPGGPPPGGPPPGGDPSGGAPPPPPPSGGGGPMPGGVDLMSALPQMVQTAVQSAMQQQGGGAGGGMGGPKAQSSIKPAEMDAFQTKKMVMHLAKSQGIEFPPDLLDGPNRDPRTGAPMAPGQPGSTSDPSVSGGDQSQSAIQPIQPMQGAFPAGGDGGGQKMGSFRSTVGQEISGRTVLNKAAAVARICRQRAARKEAIV